MCESDASNTSIVYVAVSSTRVAVSYICVAVSHSSVAVRHICASQMLQIPQ